MADDQTEQDGSIVPGAVGALAGAAGGGWAGYVKHRNNAIAEAPQTKPGALHGALESHIAEAEKKLKPESVTAHLQEQEKAFVESRREKAVNDRFDRDKSLNRSDKATFERITGEVDAHHAQEFHSQPYVKDGVPHPEGKSFAAVAEETYRAEHSTAKNAYQEALNTSRQGLNFEETKIGSKIKGLGDSFKRPFRSGQFNEIHDQIRAEMREANDSTRAMKLANKAATEARTAVHNHANSITDATTRTKFLQTAQKSLVEPLEQIHLDAVARHVDVGHNLGLAGQLEKGAAEVAKGLPMKGKLGIIAGGAALGAVAVGTAAHLLMGRGTSHADRIRAQQAQSAGSPQVG